MIQPTEISAAPTESAVEVRGLSKGFPGCGWAVQDVHLAVRRGENLSVLGPSGCGKTTLLRLIGGFELPERGEVLQGGHAISRPGWALPPERRRMGMVFQENTLFPHLTVRENVQFGLQPSLGERLRGWLRLPHANGPAPQGGATPAELITHKRGLLHLMEICGLTELAERYPHELSGGQQQRVALARALATQPALLLLDEPFSSLDTTLRQRLREDVRRILRDAGITSILVTHDQEEAINLGDRLAVMNHGRLEQVGLPEDVLRYPASRFVAAFVGLNRFLPGQVRGAEVQTELGAFPLPAQGAPAAQVDVLLRPTQVHLSSNGHAVQAEVRRVQYLSGQPLYTLALPSGLEVQALLPESVRLRPGDRAGLRFAPEPLVLFQAE